VGQSQLTISRLLCRSQLWPASYDRRPTAAADLLQQIGYLVVVGVVMQNGEPE